MYQYVWDAETGGLLLTTELSKFSKEPRPVYYKELDILGFDQYWNYPKDDHAPLMWAEANNYIYMGRTVARTKGGSLYTKPELEILESPEPDGQPLQFVDVEAMCSKNSVLMENIVQETIQNIYNTYLEYRHKIDVFYVAFSGGKDSIVTLNLVQRALPHDAFLVLFGDTGMEFPDTYDVVKRTQDQCESMGIKFYQSKSEHTPAYTWNLIGPPAQKMRWCCSVHKTAPQILLLRKITNNSQFRGMALMGVRADESVTRSKYNSVNFGAKHQGQYDYYPILNWNSAEVFLYLFQEKITINETYKHGNSRVGCLVCPMETAKNSWFKNQSYAGSPHDEHSTTFFNNIIIEKTFAHELPAQNLCEFMNIGVWKSRHNGSKLSNPRILYHEERTGKDFTITIDKIGHDWKEWLKTLGDVYFISSDTALITCEGKKYTIRIIVNDDKTIFSVLDIGSKKEEIYFLSWLKVVLRKSAYCIGCHVCEANCPNGFIKMNAGSVHIDNRCNKCKKCYKVDGGCLVASSHLLPKESSRMNSSIDQYKNMGIQYNWVKDYLAKKDSFWHDNGLGSQMITSLSAFLRHSGVCERKKITPFGELIAQMGADSHSAWALMMCNLAYTPQFMWWIENINLNHVYTQAELSEMLKKYSLTDNSRKNVISAYKNIYDSNPILSRGLGIGIVTVEKKGNNTYLVDASRASWEDPVPEVILYSLYKFSEACGGIKQFSLASLLDDTIERDGVSPTRIFGLDRDMMVRILNGLSMKYPDFINASFTLGLDSITLRDDKTSADVLTLF